MSDSSPVCAASGCTNPVAQRQGHTGRPPIYCSPACRPSRPRPTLTIEIEHDAADNARRRWVVRLRRGHHSVVLREGLGRFSATAFATELRSLLAATIDEVTP